MITLLGVVVFFFCAFSVQAKQGKRGQPLMYFDIPEERWYNKNIGKVWTPAGKNTHYVFEIHNSVFELLILFFVISSVCETIDIFARGLVLFSWCCQYGWCRCACIIHVFGQSPWKRVPPSLKKLGNHFPRAFLRLWFVHFDLSILHWCPRLFLEYSEEVSWK